MNKALTNIVVCTNLPTYHPRPAIAMKELFKIALKHGSQANPFCMWIVFVLVGVLYLLFAAFSSDLTGGILTAAGADPLVAMP